MEVSHAYKAFPNITYLTANNFDAKLDVYMPRSPGLKPTLIYIHGGGWHHGSREGADGILPISVLAALPYMGDGPGGGQRGVSPQPDLVGAGCSRGLPLRLALGDPARQAI